MVNGIAVSLTVKAEFKITIKAFEYESSTFGLIKAMEKFIFGFKIAVPGKQ